MSKKAKVTAIVARNELSAIESRTAAIVFPAHKLEVTTVEQENKALTILKAIKGQLDMIEEKRVSITQPINQSLRRTNDMFKKLSVPLTQADEIIRRKILAFRTEQDEKANREQARREAIQESHRERGHETKELAPVVAETGNSVTEMRWTYDVVDIRKVPKEYVELNLGAIRKAIIGGMRNIPGLRIYQKPVLSVRG